MEAIMKRALGQPYRRMAADRLAEVLNRIPDIAVHEVRRVLTARTDPAVRLERKYRHAVEWTWVWLALFLVFATVAVFGFLPDGSAVAAFSGTVAAALSGTVLASRAMRVRALAQQRKELPAGTPAPPRSALTSALTLPPRSSQARQPMQRLAESERTLHDLLAQLSPTDGVPPVPADAVAQARGVAAETAGALRKLAGKLVAVERAKQAAPPLERGQLADAVRELRIRLDDGVDDYGRLVAAAGRTVAASASVQLRPNSPTRAAHTVELTEATDRLHALATALNELSG
jgi:hypothetical protein